MKSLNIWHLPAMLALTATVLLPSCRAQKTVAEEVAPHNLIIFYEPQTGDAELLKAAEKYGSEVLCEYKNFNGIAVTVPRERSIPDAIKYYEQVKGVLSVTQDRLLQPD